MCIFLYIKHARPFVSFNNLLLDFIHSCRFTESSHTTEYIYIYICIHDHDRFVEFIHIRNMLLFTWEWVVVRQFGSSYDSHMYKQVHKM